MLRSHMPKPAILPFAVEFTTSNCTAKSPTGRVCLCVPVSISDGAEAALTLWTAIGLRVSLLVHAKTC